MLQSKVPKRERERSQLRSRAGLGAGRCCGVMQTELSPTAADLDAAKCERCTRLALSGSPAAVVSGLVGPVRCGADGGSSGDADGRTEGEGGLPTLSHRIGSTQT